MNRHASSQMRGRHFLLSDTALHRALPSCFNTLDFPVAGMNSRHNLTIGIPDLGLFLENLGLF